MLFNRNFYEFNKEAIEITAEKLKNLCKEMILDDFSKESELKGKELKKHIEARACAIEQNVIYTIYPKAYDPRRGYVLAVYINSYFQDKEKLIELVKKYFGEFKLRDKKGCKTSNYRNYKEQSLDFVFEGEVINGDGYKRSLNLIINGDIFKDKKKFYKWKDKAPKGIVY